MTTEELSRHLTELGRSGGRKRTPEQTKARKLNMYRVLAKSHPNSVKVQQKLRELEEEDGRIQES